MLIQFRGSLCVKKYTERLNLAPPRPGALDNLVVVHESIRRANLIRQSKGDPQIPGRPADADISNFEFRTQRCQPVEPTLELSLVEIAGRE